MKLFFFSGLDLEDIKYLKKSYNMMLERENKKEPTPQEIQIQKILNYTHWVDHSGKKIDKNRFFVKLTCFLFFSD